MGEYLEKNDNSPARVVVLGAGLAGAEAALTLARLDVPVTLIDMKPHKMSEAHESPHFAELVCSNSLKSNRPDTAQGLLKRELRQLQSQLLKIADMTAVPAGGSLSVNRELFSSRVTEEIRSNPLITLVEEEVESLEALLSEHKLVIVATGPLTSGKLYESIERVTGEGGLHFYDAVAPIVDPDTIDHAHTFLASRYGKGGADYLNCPMNEDEYKAFREALVHAHKAEVHDFDDVYFKDCQPIETLASRGEDTMRFGPLRPVGLVDPKTGKRPYACLQLRREDQEGAMWSLVGCQTRLTFPEQRRVFGLIPALSHASYFRYGVMHRNSFLKGPSVLKEGLESKIQEGLYFAGQLSGLEGYVEAIASGLVAAFQAASRALGHDEETRQKLIPDKKTMIGALIDWVTASEPSDFQPMNANFGLLPLDDLGVRVKKKDRGNLRMHRSDRSLQKTMERMAQAFLMDQKTASYHYYLPDELIAHHPAEQRDHSRLLVMRNNELEHREFFELPALLKPGDCLVVNDTRVLPARLLGHRDQTGGAVEFLLLAPTEHDTWRVLVKPGRNAKIGERIIFSKDILEADVIDITEDGSRIVRFIYDNDFDTLLETLGEVPLPPYIHETLDDPERYQTVYAHHKGSAAAPTAGLHFTDELLSEIEAMGVKIARLTLHVGVGTFRPVKEKMITDHAMHRESFSLNEEAVSKILETKAEGGRVIAVGTTSCRVLESVAHRLYEGTGEKDSPELLYPCMGETELFIYPGFDFRVVDSMITNFHLPGSTLLMLVSAFMGRERMLFAYRTAVDMNYRFFSFGDAMFLEPVRERK